MKPWTAWLARLGLAGSCMIWAGCGGSGVPDPASDSHAAAEGAPPSSSSPPPAAVQEEPAAPAPAPKAPVAAAPAESQPAASPEPAAVVVAPGAEADPQASPAPRGDTPAATNELLALASAPAATAAPATTGAPGSAPNNNSSGYNPNSSATPPGGASGPSMNMNSSATNSNSSATPPSDSSSDLSSLDANPGSGDGGGNGEDIGKPGKPIPPGTFRYPWTGAAAFLTALKAKDTDKLAQATALRAPIEGGAKYQKVFTAILDQSLAPEDLDELAKKFDNMRIIGANPPKSSGRYEIIVGRMQGTSQYHRTLTMRREKAGWKLVDISGAREFEKPIVMPAMRGGGGMHGGHHR